jgi:aspartyl-tRNA synthetase
MYRSHNCGELRINHAGSEVTLSGWVQRVRNLGAMTFVDLRDRYGITQLVADDTASAEIKDAVNHLGREFVIQIVGVVRERASKNSKIPTGDVEVELKKVTILNQSVVPPFTIAEDTDGGDEIRMRHRYLDLRRENVRKNLELRAKMAHYVRNYLNDQDFIETETPVLIKSTH